MKHTNLSVVLQFRLFYTQLLTTIMPEIIPAHNFNENPLTLLTQFNVYMDRSLKEIKSCEDIVILYNKLDMYYSMFALIDTIIDAEFEFFINYASINECVNEGDLLFYNCSQCIVFLERKLSYNSDGLKVLTYHSY